MQCLAYLELVVQQEVKRGGREQRQAIVQAQWGTMRSSMTTPLTIFSKEYLEFLIQERDVHCSTYIDVREIGMRSG